MGIAVLVAADLTIGEEHVRALDKSTLSISVAMWLYAYEFEDWRFVLSSRHLDAARGAQAYGLVHDAFTASGITAERKFSRGERRKLLHVPYVWPFNRRPLR